MAGDDPRQCDGAQARAARPMSGTPEAIRELARRVADAYGDTRWRTSGRRRHITESEVFSPSRARPLAEVRWIAWWVMRKHGWPPTAIARVWGRTHPTIHYGLRAMEARVDLQAIGRAVLVRT